LAIKYLDAKRIRGSSTGEKTVDFTDDFTSDNWLQQDSAKIGVDDTTNYRLNIELSRADNDGATVDLGSTVSDTEWVLRWKQTWTTLSAGNNVLIIVGLSDDPSSDYSSISNLSSYFMMETSASAKKRFGVNWSVDAQPFANNSRDENKVLAEDTEYFMELKRTSATTATWTAWTGSYGGTQIHTFSASNSTIGDVDNLRYIRVQNHYPATASGSGIGYIKDIEFYDGTTTVTQDDKTTLLNPASDIATGIVGTAFNPNGTIDRFDFQDPAVNGTASTQTVAYDVGAGLGNAWTLRMKVRYTTLTSGDSEIDIGLSNTNHTVGGNGTQDFVGVRLIPANGTAPNRLFRTRTVADGLPRAGADNTAWIAQAIDTDYYLQIQRTSSTAYNVRWTTNSNYTGGTYYYNGAGTNSISGNVSDLRYIKIMNGETETYTNATGQISELKFWNSTTTSGTPTLQPSFLDVVNIGENTIFEETDTYSEWWLQDGEWKPSCLINISAMSYSSKEFSIGSQETVPLAVALSVDGTKMYVSGNTSATIYQYTLVTPFDVGTANYSTPVSFSASQAPSPAGLAFKSDGLKLLVMSKGNSTIYQYTLGTAWVISSASYDSKSLSTSSQASGTSQGVTVSSDGKKNLYECWWFNTISFSI